MTGAPLLGPSSATPVRPRALRGLAVLGLALATFGRFYRRFDWRTGESERYAARTRDGWNLGLHRYRPAGAPKPVPVLCSHGMAGTRLIFDLHPSYSLARFLAGCGFDTWLVDLRGRCESWPDSGPNPSFQWSFDDFAERDLPAAVEKVCEVTRSREVFWLGMEISGQALYAAAILGLATGIRGGITCGSPVVTPRTAQVPGVTSPPRARRRGRVPYRGGARLAGPVLAYGGFRVLENSFRPCNVDPLVVARYFRNGIPDEATDLADQVADWVRERTMRNRSGSVVYAERLDQVRLPLLLLAAARDLQRPPEAVRATFDALGSADKTLVIAGRAHGFRVDYGHDDLLAGLSSPEEIFPRIASWLEQHC